MARLSAFYKQCHGVSGIGSSNPLVRPKRLYKPACYCWFFMPTFLVGKLWGITGESPPFTCSH
ncbi:hypothetical protein EZ119_24100 [Escherichia coli]|nr:hypothetical protein [Escherichia coli]EFW6853303.1 hypothetical protein [Shigella sonnei]EEY7570822.1 hypothetical protein [Escherichia coli]EFA5213790.1 hypothetical protein [Escherichia coli]EFD5085941.1 hypothetical protein [Escherichia coli]